MRKGLPEGVKLELRGNNQKRRTVANAVPSMPTKGLGHLPFSLQASLIART